MVHLCEHQHMSPPNSTPKTHSHNTHQHTAAAVAHARLPCVAAAGRLAHPTGPKRAAAVAYAGQFQDDRHVLQQHAGRAMNGRQVNAVSRLWAQPGPHPHTLPPPPFPTLTTRTHAPRYHMQGARRCRTPGASQLPHRGTAEAVGGWVRQHSPRFSSTLAEQPTCQVNAIRHPVQTPKTATPDSTPKLHSQNTHQHAAAAAVHARNCCPVTPGASHWPPTEVLLEQVQVICITCCTSSSTPAERSTNSGKRCQPAVGAAKFPFPPPLTLSLVPFNSTPANTGSQPGKPSAPTMALCCNSRTPHAASTSKGMLPTGAW